MRAFVKSVMDYTVAGFFGAILTFAVLSNNTSTTAAGTPVGGEAPKAAEVPKAVVSPKYSAYNNGPFLHINDHETNKQYIYVNSGNEPSKLLGYIDLTQAGQPEIKAVKFENGKWQGK